MQNAESKKMNLTQFSNYLIRQNFRQRQKISSYKVQSILFSAGVLECLRFSRKCPLALQEVDRNAHALRILLLK